MKVIKAQRGIYIPQDPEKPDNNSMRLLAKGVIGLVPTDFMLPSDSYEEVGKVNFQKGKKDKD